MLLITMAAIKVLKRFSNVAILTRTSRMIEHTMSWKWRYWSCCPSEIRLSPRSWGRLGNWKSRFVIMPLTTQIKGPWWIILCGESYFYCFTFHVKNCWRLVGSIFIWPTQIFEKQEATKIALAVPDSLNCTVLSFLHDKNLSGTNELVPNYPILEIS